jgi:MFS family permease
MMAGGSAIFGAACLLIISAQFATATASLALIAAAVAIGLGECFHTAALMPLVADLAPPSLRGRYMASIGLSWWVGLALAPTVGTPLLSVSSAAALLAAAMIAILAAGSMLGLERRLPDAYRLTPRPDVAAGTARARPPRR